MPGKSNVPEGILKEREIDTRFSNIFRYFDGPPFVTVPQGEWQNLRSNYHDCLFRGDIPVIVVEEYAIDEWAFRSPPARLEISQEIWEELRAHKGTITQLQLEKILGSTKKKTCPALTQGERDSTRHADQLKGITD